MAAIKREYPRFQVVGEMFDGNPALVSFFQGGIRRHDGIDSGIDALFDFPLFFPLRRAFAEGRSLRELAILQGHDWLYPHPEKLVTFLGLHDVARFMHEPGASLEGLKLAFAFLMTSRGIPLIYYGDEIGMPGGNDPDNRRDFPGGWKEDPNDCFRKEGRNPQQQAVWEYLQKLVQLRKRLDPLRSGSTNNLLVEDQQYVFARVFPKNSVVVALNNSPKESVLDAGMRMAGFSDGTILEDQIGGLGKIPVEKGTIHLKLPGRSAAILKKL
jgi:glycosidase